MRDTLNLVIGDWSCDGHNHSDKILVSTALTATDVSAAFTSVEKKLKSKYGFTLYSDVCSEYEDSELKDKHREAFEEMGVNLADVLGYDPNEESEYDDDEINLGVDSYAALVVALLNIENPALDIQIEPNQYEKSINVGGYGLFWN